MSDITLKRHIDAPADVVWNAMADIPGVADRVESITKIEMLTDGPIGKGTRWRETRVIFKKEATEEMEITEWNPPSSYVAACESCGCTMACEITVTPEGSGSLVQMTMNTKPLNLFAKIMNAIIGGMMMKQCLKAMEKDLDGIEQSITGEAPRDQGTKASREDAPREQVSTS